MEANVLLRIKEGNAWALVCSLSIGGNLSRQIFSYIADKWRLWKCYND